MDYSNIFNYYRGQTKKENSLNLGSKQVENNIKKALLNVLEHSNHLLTLNFIKQFIDHDHTLDSQAIEYGYEVGRRLNTVRKKAFVLGIAETKDLINTSSEIKNTRPDGMIITDSILVLIETKTGTDQLNLSQLEGHKKTFANGQIIDQNPVLLLWSEIKDFFKDQKKFFNIINDKLTYFLLEQFEQFCDNNSVGLPRRSKEYFYSLFKTSEARNLAKEINDYIYFKNKYGVNVEDFHDKYRNGLRSDCIGYVSKQCRFKFASVTSQRNVCFALQLGSRHSGRAEAMQKEIDYLLRNTYKDTDSSNLTPGEAYIRLEWVDNLDQIKHFIDEAYYLRLQK